VLGICSCALAQNVEFATVLSKPVSRTVELPSELLPFLTVSVHAKVAGYVDRVLVDRGSVVKQGDLLVELTAPEMKAQIVESESKLQAAEADRLQAAAQLEAARSTADRLKEAAKTPGAIAGNELIVAEKQVEAAQALVKSREQAAAALKALIQSQKELESYLTISAPFEGIVTERAVHPGALATVDAPLLSIEQVSHLRLVVPVPEEDVGSIAKGTMVSFHVPAFPERNYTGTVARIAHVLDQKTRTMAVELDVFNRDGSLAPGMYPSVRWPVRATRPALWVPKTSVVRTTERVFVIRQRDGRGKWVDVKPGVGEADLIEVMGDLKPGDRVVKRATDEIRDGAALK
jgi:RND family efflux transporter MFP subunit